MTGKVFRTELQHDALTNKWQHLLDIMFECTFFVSVFSGGRRRAPYLAEF